MKRRKLFDFANYLEKSRTPFNIGDASCCIAFYACRFNGEVKNGIITDGTRRVHERYAQSQDLHRIFDIRSYQARDLYSGFGWNNVPKITRKVAAAVVRRLARTGKVDWGKLDALMAQ